MSFVYARELPKLAFWWNHSAGDEDFNRLEADVIKAGGTIEKTGNGKCSVRVGGRQFGFSVGFAVVLENGSVRMMPVDLFEQSFDRVEAADDVAGRLAAVEKAVSAVEQALAALDGKGKAKTEK